MHFKINWHYLGEHKKPGFFTQTCGASPSSYYMPDFCGGMYISNLINACSVEVERMRRGLYSEALSMWESIAGENYIVLNGRERLAQPWTENYIFSDAMAYPAFCIFENIRATLNDVYKKLSNPRYVNWSECTYALLGETLINMLNERTAYEEEGLQKEIQDRIDIYMYKYNDMLTSALEGDSSEFYHKLISCLRAYNGGGRIIKKYLKSHGGRCFATFIEQQTRKKYISFSGFIDAVDPNILNWANGSATPNSFVAVAQQICASMCAEFVPLNLFTRRYNVTSPLPFYVTQGLAINDLINLGYKASACKQYYSCCERKIFGRFCDNTPDGSLYVKMKACGECGLGLIYQWSQGHKILLYDGLDC